MALDVYRVAIEAIRALRPVVARVRRGDRSLADQLRRAASSVALNIAEAERSDGGNARARFHTAAGSANETRAALEVALAWGQVAEAEAREALELIDRVNAMLWRLTRRTRLR